MLWIHRHTNDGEIYFISNQRYQPESFTIAFRQTGKSPELWNPQTGEVSPAPVWRESNGITLVTLQMSAADSVFIVFRAPAKADHLVDVAITSGSAKPNAAPIISVEMARYEAVDGTGGADVTDKVAEMVRAGATSVDATNENFGDPTTLHVKRLHVVYTLDGKRMDKSIGENEELTFFSDGSDIARPDYDVVLKQNAWEFLPWSAGEYQVELSNGSTKTVRAEAPLTASVTDKWKLTFPPKLGAPGNATFSKLISWPDSLDSGIKYFSGSAVYETALIVPKNLFHAGHEIYLDLGSVKNFAEVWVNGTPMGTLWKPPFRLDVTGRVHPGRNTLRIRVTNLWPNRIIGDEQLPSDVEWNGEVIKAWPNWLINGKPRPPSQRITFTTWRVFSKDSPLYPAGLIGPVELISIVKVPLGHD
jgi:hypothetical protein